MVEMDDSDLKDVIAAETSRGRRHPIDPEARRQHRELLKGFRKRLEEGSEADFLKAIRALGLKDGSPEFENALAVWRELRGRP